MAARAGAGELSQLRRKSYLRNRWQFSPCSHRKPRQPGRQIHSSGFEQKPCIQPGRTWQSLQVAPVHPMRHFDEGIFSHEISFSHKLQITFFRRAASWGFLVEGKAGSVRRLSHKFWFHWRVLEAQEFVLMRIRCSLTKL
jgi:hypothetical protein